MNIIASGGVSSVEDIRAASPMSDYTVLSSAKRTIPESIDLGRGYRGGKMITKRIIPCLDVKNGRVVKGVNFEGLSDVSSPCKLWPEYYSRKRARMSLVFYDITASFEGRAALYRYS